MRYLIIAIILLLTSCSQRTMMSIKARHHYNRDSAGVLRVRERNPTIIANEFKRMLANDELKQKYCNGPRYYCDSCQNYY